MVTRTATEPWNVNPTRVAAEPEQKVTTFLEPAAALVQPSVTLATGTADLIFETPAGWPHEVPVAEMWLLPTYQHLAELAELEQDWDAYGAAAISRRAITRARDFVSAVREEFAETFGEAIQPYAVVPLADGGMQLEWRGSRDALELEIGPRGGLSYLLVQQHESGATYEENEHVSSARALKLVARTLGS